MARGEVIWFYGADAVGKSAVGWEAYSQLVDRGLPTAYVDTDYLGFCDPRSDDPFDLVAANLGAVWTNYAKQGIRYLVVSGILVTAEHRQKFAATLGDSSLTAVLLQAQPSTIQARILRRRQLEAAEQQTSLSDTVLEELHNYGDRSARFAALLEAVASPTTTSTLTTRHQRESLLRHLIASCRGAPDTRPSWAPSAVRYRSAFGTSLRCKPSNSAARRLATMPRPLTGLIVVMPTVKEPLSRCKPRTGGS